MEHRLLWILCVIGMALQACLGVEVFQFSSSSADGKYIIRGGAESFSRTAVSSGGGTKDDPYLYTVPFSDNEPLSPATGYAGPKFYGGYQIKSTGSPVDILQERVQRSMRFGANTTSRYLTAIMLSAVREKDRSWEGALVEVSGVILFKQSDFKEAYSTGNLKLEGLNASALRYGGMTSYSGHWVIRLSNGYHISESGFEFPLNGTSQISINEKDLSSMKWAEYNPFDGIQFNRKSAVFSSRPLTGITAAGIYFSGAVRNSAYEDAFTWALGEFSILGGISQASGLDH